MKPIKPTGQHDGNDCGAACLCSVARAFGYHAPLSRIRQLTSTERNGTSVMGIVEGAEKMGLIAKGIKGPPEALRSAPVPSIAHIELKPGHYHFVVLTRVGKRRVKFMDPDGGRMRSSAFAEMEQKWTGVLIIVAPGPSFEKASSNPSLISRFTQVAGPLRGHLLQALTGTILFTLIGLSTSLFVQKIMDFVLVNHNPNLLNLMGTAMVILLIFRMLISWYKSLILLKAGHQIDGGLLLGYYRHLLALPQRFFDTMRTGEILSRMSDAIKIRVFINHSLVELIVAVLTILITLGAMALLSWQVCLLAASAMPVYLVLYTVIDRINKRVLRKLMEETAELESRLVESVRSQRTIRSFGWQNWSTGQISERLTHVLRGSYRAGISSLAASHSTDFVSALLTILLLWIGSGEALRGRLSPGELMSAYALLGYLTAPLQNLAGMNRTMRDAIIAADRLFQVLDLEQEDNLGAGILPDSLNGNIELRNVRFRYGSRPELFNDLSLTIPAGKLTGIVGSSGSGKSTIASLIRAEYAPTGGCIMINQINIGQMEKNNLRKKVAIVPQHIEIFSGSILENILPGLNNIDWKKLLWVADQTGLKEMIEHLPEGYNTRIGEQGLGLSGGERQRIAFARALYHQPDILILDEFTAALDPPSESEIMNAVQRLRTGNQTMIIITHKLGLVKDADHIVLIGHGKVIESGHHGELIQRKGNYYRLWKNS
jgi:ATP-binding cassette subfamily B protein